MPYNIALPDGRVVTNIPDDVTPEQAKARLLEAYPDLAKMAPPAVGEFATPKAPAPAEERSTLQYLKDLGLSLQTGFTQDIRSRGAALGTTGTTADKFAIEASAHLEGLKSAAAKNNQQEIARILESAKDKGILDQVAAGAKAFGVDPGMFIAGAAGSLPSSILFGLFGKPVQATAGAISGAGVVKTAMYDTVKEELTKAGLPPEEVEKRAMAAQDYFGKNPGMILAGAGLGAIEAITGLEKTVSKVLLRRVAQDVGKEELEAIAKQGLVKTVAKGVVGEAPLEFAQGAQEQLASNIALQNAGVDTPTMRGVISQGVIEGLAAGVLGGAVGPIQRAQARNALAQNDPAVAEIKDKIDGLQNTPPPPGSDEERVLQLAAQLEARGNVDRQSAMIMAMKIVADENTQSEKIDGPKPPEITGGAPLFVFDTPEQAQERTRLLKLNRPKENFAFQEMPNGKFGVYKIPVETTGVQDVAKPIDETGGVGTELLGGRESGAPAGGVAATVPAGLDVAGATVAQPDVGKAVQPSPLGGPSEATATAPAAAVPSAIPDISVGAAQPAVQVTPAEALETPPATTPATTVTPEVQAEIDRLKGGEPSVAETPEAIEAEEKRSEETAAPKSEEVISAVETEANAAIEEVNAAAEELTAALEERDAAAATREKGQGEPAALRRLTQKASEKLEAAIAGKSGLINVIDKLTVELDQARAAIEPYGGETFSEDMLRRRAETTEEEFSQDVADMETAYSYYNAVKRAREQAIRSLAEFEANPVFDRGGVHPAKAKALEAMRTIPYADKLAAYKAVGEKTEALLETEKAAAAEPVAPAKPAAPPVVTVKKKRQIEIPAASKKTSQEGGAAVAETKAGGTAQEQKIQSELIGKTLLEAADWTVANAPNKFAKYIAERVRERLTAMAKRGIQLEFTVMDGQRRLTSLSGAKGICTTDWGNNKVSVSLNGVPVIDNQLGYPSGMNYVTVLHELIHAATVAQNHFLPAGSALRTELNDLFNTVVKHFNAEVKAGRMTPFMERVYKREINALRNPDELIAWALTDADMQEFLSSIKIDEKSVLEQFVEWVRQVLNISPEYTSALDQIIRTTDKLLTKSVEEIASDVEASGKFKYGKITSPQGERVVIPPTSQARVSKRVATSLKTDPTFNQFSGMSITASLQHIAETGNPFERALATRLLARDNRAGVKDTKMYVLDEEGVQELENTEADMEGAAGLYFLGKTGDAIFLRGEQFDENGINNQTVLHEALHATVNKRIIYAMYARELGLPVSDNLERTVAELNELLARAETALDQFLADNKAVPENIQHLIDGGAFDNVTEFVTYGMTDPAMQRFLRDNVEGVVTKRNGLADFVRLILDMMGLGPEHVSGLRDLIEYTNNLAASVSVDPATARAVLDTTKENRVLDIQAASKAAKRKETKSEEIQRKIAESADADQIIEELGSLSTVAKNPKLWGEYLTAKFTDINVDAMNVLLAAMPTNIVVETGVNKGITRLADIDTDTREMATMRTRILNRVQEIATPWIKLSPPIQKQLGKVMAAATLAQIDPATDKTSDKVLYDMYNALTPEAKAVYKNVRDFYADQYELYKVLLERAAKRMGGEEKAKDTLAAIKALYEVAKNKGPYFPLMRYGQFYARFGKGASKEFYMFESAGLRDAFVTRKMADLAKKGEKRTFDEMVETGDADLGNDVEGMRKELLKDNMQLQNIFNMIDKASGLGDEKIRAVLKDQIYQMHLMTMPEASMRKHFIHRQGVTGFSGDALRNFLNSGTRMASQIARVRYSTDISNNISAAKESLKGNPEKDKLGAIIKEIEARTNDELNPPIDDTLLERLARKTNKVAFLYMLTSAKSALNQMFSVLNFTLPTLAARHGWFPAMTEMGKYLALGYGQMGIVKTNIDGSTSWIAPTIALSDRVAKNPDEQYAVQRMQDMGISDATRTYDLFLRRGQPSVDYNSRWNKITGMMGALFHHSERISREITFMTSFRLAKEKGMTREQAVEQAVKDTNTALFDYSAWNRPRVLRPAPVRMVAQFKQFPMYVTLYLARNGYNIIKSGATFQERKEAATMLFGTLGMTALMAGASGSFGYSVIMGAIQGIRNALRDDDEEDPLEEQDFELWFRNVYLPELCGDTTIMGMKLSELIDSGVLNTATGYDVASGISLNNLWFHDTPEANNWKSGYENLLISMMGPGISVGKQIMSGIDDFNNGEYLKSIEKFSPAFFRGTATAIRYDQEGAKSTTGAEIKAKEDFTTAQLAAQMLGFRTTGLAQIMNNNFAIQQMVNGLKSERANLMKRLDIAIESGNDENVESVLDDIDTFGARNPTYRIKNSEIASSLKAREKVRRQSEAGLYLDKRAKDFETLRDRALDNLERESSK